MPICLAIQVYATVGIRRRAPNANRAAWGRLARTLVVLCWLAGVLMLVAGVAALEAMGAP